MHEVYMLMLILVLNYKNPQIHMFMRWSWENKVLSKLIEFPVAMVIGNFIWLWFKQSEKHRIHDIYDTTLFDSIVNSGVMSNAQ